MLLQGLFLKVDGILLDAMVQLKIQYVIYCCICKVMVFILLQKTFCIVVFSQEFYAVFDLMEKHIHTKKIRVLSYGLNTNSPFRWYIIWFAELFIHGN